jgi:lycopene beta-cyclase
VSLTYGSLLLIFVIVPIIGLGLVNAGFLLERKNQGTSMAERSRRSPWVALALLIVVAVLYTAPWDNHLIAAGVWWYSPARISGIAIGQIPLEEVLFFPLQTLLIGLWFIVLLRARSREGLAADSGLVNERGMQAAHGKRVQPIAGAMGGALWLTALIVLCDGWRPGTYLSWELVWALPPLLLQVGLGGDILWRRRRLLAKVLAPVVIYLSAVDTLAIHQEIWTISPQQTLGVLVGGVLPLEEIAFFALSSALVAFGLALGIASAPRQRIRAFRMRVAYALGQR